MSTIAPSHCGVESAYDTNRRNHSALYIGPLVSLATLIEVQARAADDNKVVQASFKKGLRERLEHPNAGQASLFFLSRILDYSLPELTHTPGTVLQLADVANEINATDDLSVAVTVNNFYRPHSGFAGFPIPTQQPQLSVASEGFLIAYRKVHELYVDPHMIQRFLGRHPKA